MDKSRLPINVCYPKGEEAITLICESEFKCQEIDNDGQMKFSRHLQTEIYQVMESVYLIYQQKLDVYSKWFNCRFQNVSNDAMPTFSFPNFRDWVCYLYPKFFPHVKKILNMFEVIPKPVPKGVALAPPRYI